jgi:hypothetical protein
MTLQVVTFSNPTPWYITVESAFFEFEVIVCSDESKHQPNNLHCKEMNVRQATVDDLPAMQNCNLMNLPENYQLKYCTQL